MCSSSGSEPSGGSATSCSSCGAWGPIVRARPGAFFIIAARPAGDAPAKTCQAKAAKQFRHSPLNQLVTECSAFPRQSRLVEPLAAQIRWSHIVHSLLHVAHVGELAIITTVDSHVFTAAIFGCNVQSKRLEPLLVTYSQVLRLWD